MGCQVTHDCTSVCFVIAPCADVDAMSPESNNNVDTSSNKADANNMKEEGDARWVSDSSDETPSVTIEVADNDSFIKSVSITNTTNVDSVTVTVFDEAGNQVPFKEY